MNFDGAPWWLQAASSFVQTWFWPLVLTFVATKLRRSGWNGYLLYVASVGSIVSVLWMIPPANPAHALGCATAALVALLIYQWRRRKRRRTLALLGAKAKTRLAAMARNLRERAKPAPRPQWVPS